MRAGSAIILPVSSMNALPIFSGSGSGRPASCCEAMKSCTIFRLRSAMDANRSAAAAISGGVSVCVSVCDSVMARVLSGPWQIKSGRTNKRSGPAGRGVDPMPGHPENGRYPKDILPAGFGRLTGCPARGDGLPHKRAAGRRFWSLARRPQDVLPVPAAGPARGCLNGMQWEFRSCSSSNRTCPFAAG